MNRARRTPSALAAASLVALAAVVVPATSGSAATTAGWAGWDDLSGSAGDWSTTMQLPAGGFPAATMSSDSRGGSVGVISGASTWLADSTPPGAVYGSSRDQPYVNLRPQADRAATPSTTTYTFERPTPAGGWAFVLGDIDADSAVVSALGQDGQPLTAAELGWQGGFNYCQGGGTPSCNGTEVPTWDPATGTLMGNATATDTNGASGWFQPTVPVTSLTIEFSWRSGFPVYQTWFASLARDVTGTVTLDDGSALEGATLTLFGPDGTELATTTSGADGTYAFAGYTAAPGYRVEMTELPGPSDAHPFGLVAAGPNVVDGVDLTDTDGVADFQARDIQPVAVSGTVLDDDGNPVPGATVTLTPVGGGDPITAVTSSRGEYLVDDVAWDVENDQPQEYEFSLGDLPDGHTVTQTPPNITVEVGQEEAITGNDFVVQGPAAVSGTVTAGGDPVAGVVVTIDGPDGPVSTTTAADGTYAFEDVPPGDHAVTVVAPDGYTVDGPATRDVTVGTDDVTGVDFALASTGAIGGTVTDDEGNPVPGATVTVEGPDGPVELTTDDEGVYFVDDLPAGGYVITLTVPDGYTAEQTERTVAVTPAGESFLAEDFALVAEPVEPATHPAGGTVTDTDGAPVPGAEVTVTDAQGEVVAALTTGDDGTWTTDLPAGGYTATVTAPDGYTVDGAASLTFEVVDAEVGGLDFVLAAQDSTPGPDPTPGPSAPGAPGSPGEDPGAPDGGAEVAEGAGDLPLTGAEVGAAALGALLLVTTGGLLLRAARRRAVGSVEA
ncbi:carboxypeptidase regulatory-like domain-containing protein [Isoptericola cucumis]|uniref:MSCRAMM family protein n=1 Tax=Isoptericola cucumis TaxID=1776856 RepID=UPI00320B4B69